jgi:hypothetical protein
MTTYEHGPAAAVFAGCAGRILAHLRERGVTVWLPPGPVGAFTLDAGILTQSWTAEAQACVRLHALEVAKHRERISLLLLAELGGTN